MNGPGDCKPVMFDPLEWLYVITMARSLLPELSFHADGAATRVAASLGGLSIDALRDLDWSSPAIFMPPFEKAVGGSVTVAVEGHTARRLQRRGIRPDVVVTDLDFEPEGVEMGRFVVVHAHGDNYWRLPARPWIYTVQTWPVGCTHNISGFTDGDRAVYLAYYMGAREVTISGFNPGAPLKRDDSVKRRKLALASHLIMRLSLRIPVTLV
ncbi:MAG: DUF115 domain-containing protein [Thermoproteaceae archaeon]|nr:DUF115 domain-containing protein [Thermoproteaceae archaeon]